MIHEARNGMGKYDERAAQEAELAFEGRYPEVAATHALDRLRSEEYGRLDAQGHVYLDYTGGGLYAESQLRAHYELLSANVFGNPHSENPTSLAMTGHVEATRRAVLDFFHADPDEYCVIFTPNASGALKLIAESYPFSPSSRFVLAADNHNSVNGIREFARARGAEITYLLTRLPDLRLPLDEVRRALALPAEGAKLFAFPAQSNFSGVKHPLALIEEAQALDWDVLLDAAAFVPTNSLDLRAVKPDFLTLSFYKMFGYPTGLGALIARRSSLRRLCRPWFAGGTVAIASVQGNGHFLLPDHAGFEDGTVDYLSIPAVKIGLDHLARVGVETIQTRVRCLTGWLLDEMGALRHANGRSLATLHGPTTTEARGGTIAFSLYDPEGAMIDPRRIEELAASARISLRTGCFCNPGSGEIAFDLSERELAPIFRNGVPLSLEELRRVIHDEYAKDVSAVRISFGIASSFADAHRFMAFLATFVDCAVEEIGVARSLACPHLAVPDQP